MDDFKKLMYGVVIGFVVVVVVFVSFTFLWSCGLDFSCRQASPLVERTPIPTLSAAHISSAPITTGAGEFDKCQVRAMDLLGAWVEAGAPETDAFAFTDMRGVACQAGFSADVYPLLNESQVWYPRALSCTSCHNGSLSAIRSGGLDLSTYAAILAGSGRESADVAKGKDILGSWLTSRLYLSLTMTENVVVGHPTMEQANTLVVFAGSPAPQPEATPAP
jgi:hypothetical protein